MWMAVWVSFDSDAHLLSKEWKHELAAANVVAAYIQPADPYDGATVPLPLQLS